MRWGINIGGLLMVLGPALILWSALLLIATVMSVDSRKPDSNLPEVEPYPIILLFGWIVMALAVLFLAGVYPS